MGGHWLGRLAPPDGFDPLLVPRLRRRQSLRRGHGPIQHHEPGLVRSTVWSPLARRGYGAGAVVLPDRRFGRRVASGRRSEPDRTRPGWNGGFVGPEYGGALVGGLGRCRGLVSGGGLGHRVCWRRELRDGRAGRGA